MNGSEAEAQQPSSHGDADDKQDVSPIPAWYVSVEQSLVESPYRLKLLEVLRGVCDYAMSLSDPDDRTAVGNAIYLTVQKRMCKREYSNGVEYISGLLADLQQGEYEMEQVCYQNSHADSALYMLKGQLLALITDTQNG